MRFNNLLHNIILEFGKKKNTEKESLHIEINQFLSHSNV